MPVMDLNKNTTAYMSEEDVLEMYEKIQQNRAEEQQLAENLQKLLDGDKKLASSPLIVGKTPNALAICDANGDLDLTIKKGVVDKCLRPEIRDENGRLQGKTGHGLTQEQLLQALNSIKTPAMILSGSRENSLVAVTDLKDDKDREILVAVELNKANGFCEVNNITSVYGRENFSEFLDVQMQNGKVLAENTEKANEMLRSIGKKYPKENTLISFDNSIAYSTQNVKYPQENNLEQAQNVQMQRSEKLLPFLNAKANNLDSRLESLAEKKTTREDKIARNEAKIQRLSDRADRLDDINQMLSTAFSRLPFVQDMIERNQEKIDQIRNDRIPKREAKIAVHKEKIAQLDGKASVVQHKLERCIALDKAIRSFTISNNAERRQTFAQAMDSLHSSTINCLTDKHTALTEKSAAITDKYEQTSDSVEKVSLQNELSNVNARAKAIENKIEKLSRQNNSYAEKTDAQIDAAIAHTSQKVAEQLDSGEISIPKLSEEICMGSDAVEQQKEQDNPLKNAEMAIEDDYNSIDGIINNGKKEEQPNIEEAEVQQQPEEQQNIEETDVPQQPKEEPSAEKSEDLEIFEASKSNGMQLPEDLRESLDDVHNINFEGTISTLIPDVAGINAAVNTQLNLSDKQLISLIERSDLPDKTGMTAEELVSQGNVKAYAKYALGDAMWEYSTGTSVSLIHGEQDPSKIAPTGLEISKHDKHDSSKIVLTDLERAAIRLEIESKSMQQYSKDANQLIQDKESELSYKRNVEGKIKGLEYEIESLEKALLNMDDGKEDFRSKIDDLRDKIEAFASRLNNEEQPDIEETDILQQSEELQSIEETNVPQQSEKKQSVEDADVQHQENTPDIRDQQITQLQAELAAERQYSRSQAEKISELAENALKLQMAHFTILPNEIAEKTIDNLNRQGVQFSSVKMDNEVTSIAVDNNDKSALQTAEKDVKTIHCKEVINNGFYNSLPKEDRFTQRMSESDARSVIQQLADKGIEHSAVLDGRKSAVTVSIKDEQKARPFLSNKQRQKEAQRIKQQPKHEKTPEKQRKQKQEIG